MTHSNEESTNDETDVRENDDTLPMGAPAFGPEAAAERPRYLEGDRSILDFGAIEASGDERAEGAWVRSATGSPPSPPKGNGARRSGLGPRARQFRPMRLEDIGRKRSRSRPERDGDSWF